MQLKTRGAPAVAGVALTVMLTLGLAAPGSAAPIRPAAPPQPVVADPGPTVPTRPGTARPATQDRVPRMNRTSAVSWPAAGTAEVALTTTATTTTIGTLPLSLAPAGDSTPAKVQVELLDRTAAAYAGVSGLLLRLRRTDGRKDSGHASLTLDYSAFRNAYGGDWAARLRLVKMDATGRTALGNRNDLEAGKVTAQVAVTPDSGVYALEAAPAGATGDYRATSLSPSASWQVSTQTGDFTWSHPVGDPPPVPGGFAPSFALSYVSGSVDGRIASANNQPSWVGEGWDLGTGFVERRYKACADDLAAGQVRTGDLCWETDNATLSLGGHATQLVKIAGTNTWRPKDDDGSRVEQLFGADNGARNGEYWRITTTDGTQHYFGMNRPSGQQATGSTWTVPVFGNDAGEPCHGSSFATSSCQQAWRWNLDYSVDWRGNTITYFYAPETNRYGLNLGATTASYTRGGTLLRAEYGTRRGKETTNPATARIMFTTADRCVTGTTCPRTAADQPDVPWDQNCDTATCPGKYSPTFWTTKRLTRVTSQVRDGTGYRDVDQWTLGHSFPLPGDGTTGSLWLDSVTYTGLVGGSQPTPPETFLPSPYNNRVDTTTDGLPPMVKFRISTVRNSSGGEVNVVYDRDCVAGALPAADANNTRCYPIRWTPEGAPTRDDWFSKYAVARITENDRVGGGALMVTNYEYLGGAGWRYNDDELIPAENRTWSRFRGYEKVRVLRGDPTVQGVVRSATVYQYFRGMNGDRLANGGTRTAMVTDTQGTRLDDDDQLAGFLREETTYNGVNGDGSNGPEVSGTINDPYQRQTATQGALRSYQIDIAKTRTRVALDSGSRNTQVEYSYNDEGLATAVSDLGDTATAGDDLCTRTEYARNTTTWLLDLPSRQHAVSVGCSATPVYPNDAISDERTYYDGGDLGVPPTTGTVIRTEELSSFSGTTPAFVTTSTNTYDSYGRVIESHDALDRRTAVLYTPATGRPTSMTRTNPKGFRTTTTLDSSRGQELSILDVDNNRKTELSYDAAGRITGVWGPGRTKGTDDPNVRYRYRLRSDGTSWIATEKLTPNLKYVTSYALFDGFLRERQTQSPGAGGGRVFTTTHYDSRGLAIKRSGPEHATGGPSGDLITVDDSKVYTQTATTYDGAERPTRTAFRSLNVEKWSSTVGYHGDHVDVTPPAGGRATTTYTDARGRTTKLRQYHGTTPAGAYDQTQYTYTKAGELASVTDPAGNRWSYDYDLRGRKIRSVDPDAGTATYTYDDGGQLATVSDARGTTLTYIYDQLGRKTAVRLGSPTGTSLADWTYDTLAGGKGLLASSSRHVGQDTYTTEITGYEPATGWPTGTSITIPDSETGLAGTYVTSIGYLPDGSVDTVDLPALGTLDAETLVYDYDDLGLPTGLSSNLASYVTGTAYSWYGQRTQLTMGEVGKEAWHTQFYDDATHRLSRAYTQRRGTASVDDIRYSTDPTGNVSKITDTLTGTATEAQCFQYDYLRRLYEAWTSTADCAGAVGSSVGGPAPYWTSLRYDLTGNRTSEVRHASGGDTVRTYTYPAAGQPQPHTIRSVATTGPGGSTTDTYGYDASGNTTSRPGQTLTWDDESHLASIGQSSYVYDAGGNRLISRDATGKTLYLASGEVRYTNGGTSNAGTRYYRHGGETVAVRTSAGVNYLFHDHHGTDEIMVNASSLALSKRRSDPFGNPRGQQPTWPGSHGFVGGVKDPTGLTHLGAREYDPAIGRFISVDPITDSSDPQQMNGYAYANNNPTTWSDPTGLIINTRCPDGECRFGGYKPGQSPAARFNPSKPWIRNGDGARCPDGAKICPAVRGSAPNRVVAWVKPRPRCVSEQQCRAMEAWNALARNEMERMTDESARLGVPAYCPPSLVGETAKCTRTPAEVRPEPTESTAICVGLSSPVPILGKFGREICYANDIRGHAVYATHKMVSPLEKPKSGFPSTNLLTPSLSLKISESPVSPPKPTTNLVGSAPMTKYLNAQLKYGVSDSGSRSYSIGITPRSSLSVSIEESEEVYYHYLGDHDPDPLSSMIIPGL